MAFIRRHRVALVPLFVGVLAAVGALLLLRGESDEPAGSVAADGNVLPTEPRVAVQAWQEDVAKRTQHGREYEFVYTVEYTDPETNETVTDQYASTVRERGANVCYRDASGEWVPSVAEWVKTATGFKMDTNSWQIEVARTLGGACAYTVGGKTLSMRPSYLLLSDGVRTVSLGTLDTTVTGQIAGDDPSKLVFADVLGANSGVDIELVVEYASLHQNVVFRSKPLLPVSFDEENSRLYVYTELGLDALTADRNIGVKIGDTVVNTSAADLVTTRNECDPIKFTLATTDDNQRRETVLHCFTQSRVWDSSGAPSDTCAARQLWRSPTDSRTYLVESIDYAYVDGAMGVVTIDYESVNGDIDQDETWTADATYYVSGTVNIGAGKTLTIEPGTVVKFAAGTRIWAQETDSTVIAKGEPYNYIVFTSETDDNAGEDLTPGESTSGERSYYSNALLIDYGASAQCAVEYCKAAFAVVGFSVSLELAEPIQHCIVYDCWYGIAPGRRYSTSASDVRNCLVLDCPAGICTWHEAAATFDYMISNCTFGDACGRGIEIHIEGTDPTLSIDIRDNLFTGCTAAGIKMVGTDTVDWTVRHNAFYDTDPMYDNISSNSNTISLTASPYETGVPTGDYYLNAAIGGGGYCRKTKGSRSYTAAGLADDVFTYLKPTVQTADITETTEWKKLSDESNDDWPDPNDNVAIGYHHCRIDYVIGNTRAEIGDDENAVELTIEPGVVVAFNGTSGELTFLAGADEDATLTCVGEPGEFIIMAGKPVVSMDVEAQIDDGVWAHQTFGIRLNDITGGGDETVSIRYTRFMGLDRAVFFEKDSDKEVQHCIFERAHAPLHGWAQNKTIAIHNCLSHYNCRGAWLSTRDTSTNYTLTNCTFDRNEIGLVFAGCGYGSMEVTDSLFTDNGTGIQLSSAPLSFTADYNAYWNCGPANSRKIWKNYSPYGEYATGVHSVVLAQYPYDPTWTQWSDQWRLHQTGACVDAGHTYAVSNGVRLEQFTTALGGALDTGMVDVGYHYGGELDGVEKVELKVDGDPIVDAYFSSSHTLQIVVDFTNNSGTWEIFVNDETTNQTGEGDMNGVLDADARLDFSGWDPGAYTVRITYTGGDTDDIEFAVYIDNDEPAATIKSPVVGSAITGY